MQKTFILSLFLLNISVASYTQDSRTLETKIADLLIHFPANDFQVNNQIMHDIVSLGETGIKQICNQITSSGKGDDSKQRLVVESLSRYLSQKNKENDREMWEKICISYALSSMDNAVKDFFMRQLQLVGGVQSVNAMKIYLGSKDLCGPALSVISAVGGRSSEIILAESLKDENLPCAAAVINKLAAMKSQLAMREYIKWAESADVNIRTSAYNALAQSGSPLAYPILLRAAKDVLYRWEHTGATASLLNYARIVGQHGDTTTLDQICKLVIKKCDDNTTIQNKITALDIYVSFHGIKAITELIKAASHPNEKYRTAAIKISLSVPGTEVVRRWIDYFPQAIPAAKPEIISMLGIRGDEMALSLVTSSLSDQNPKVRRNAAEAIVKIGGDKSINALINYLLLFSDRDDQEAAKSALMKVMTTENMRFLIPVMKEGPAFVRKSAIELFEWNKNNKYFSEVFPYASSEDEQIKAAAIKALTALAGHNDQEKLIELLSNNSKQDYISEIQAALASCALINPDPEMRSSIILNALNEKIQKEKVIPVLALTGGKQALSFVFKEFENGNPEMRDICFKALTDWCDYSASDALFEICSSGNKTFEGAAFNGFVNHIKTAPITDEQKLLQFKKIIPFALSPDRVNILLTETGKLKTYQSLYFVANYLDDPATSEAAAKAAMLIALPSITNTAGLYGNLVKTILTKALEKIGGLEIEYDKDLITKYLDGMSRDSGFNPMFNMKDLSGWKREDKKFNDFEMIIDWKILNGGPGYNVKNQSGPLMVVENKSGEWNTYRIVLIGEKVSVWLNGKLVLDKVVMENSPDHNIPVFSRGPVELKTLGNDVEFRDIYIRDITEKEYLLTPQELAEGFESMFNGKNLNNWIGKKDVYKVDNGIIVVTPAPDSGGNLFTEKEYSDFIFRFEFLLTTGANSGVAIRTPLTGEPAYSGMEIKIVDNTYPLNANLKPFQYDGSVYGVTTAKKGYQKPVGEWNYEEIKVVGTKITVTLNGTEIVESDISGPRDNGTLDHVDHPGLKNTAGHIGFIGHNSELKFQNIRIKDLVKK
jgi:HEAT repeat protein